MIFFHKNSCILVLPTKIPTYEDKQRMSTTSA